MAKRLSNGLSPASSSRPATLAGSTGVVDVACSRAVDPRLPGPLVNPRSRKLWRRGAARPLVPAVLLACVGLLGLLAGETDAQQVHRPGSVWGEVPQEHEGLILGNVELLASLLISLVGCWGFSLWLLLEKVRWNRLARVVAGSEAERLTRLSQRRRTLLSWLTYAVFPSLGILAILASASRSLFGVEVAFIATLLALAGVMTGMAAFLVSSSVRDRLQNRLD